MLAACDEARVPVTAAAGRSGVCGGSVPVHGGIALDLTGLEGVVRVDETSLTADVRAGTFGPDLEVALGKVGDGYTLGHWPQSMDLSTVGGWLACRGAGQYSTRYGKIEDMVIGLEVVLADGRVVHTEGRGPRAATGPNLTQLFVGSEGTLGIITEARLRIHPLPPAQERRAVRLRLVRRRPRGVPPHHAPGRNAGRVAPLRRGRVGAELRARGHQRPHRARRGRSRHPGRHDDRGRRGVRRQGGRRAPRRRPRRTLARTPQRRLRPRPALARAASSSTRQRSRASGLHSPGSTTRSSTRCKAVDGTLAASAHQSHSYVDGACLYFTFGGRGPDGDGAWRERYYRQCWDVVTDATLDHGAAISHHHGIGLNRSRFLPRALGSGFEVLRGLKQTFDPNGILNPGKFGLDSPFGPAPWA